MAVLRDYAVGETYQKPKNKLRLISVSRSFDMPFLIILMVILVLGLISLLSASHAYSYYWNRGDSYFYIKRQIIFALVGVALMLIVSAIDYHILHHLAIPLMIVSIFCLSIL